MSLRIRMFLAQTRSSLRQCFRRVEPLPATVLISPLDRWRELNYEVEKLHRKFLMAKMMLESYKNILQEAERMGQTEGLRERMLETNSNLALALECIRVGNTTLELLKERKRTIEQSTGTRVRLALDDVQWIVNGYFLVALSSRCQSIHPYVARIHTDRFVVMEY